MNFYRVKIYFIIITSLFLCNCTSLHEKELPGISGIKIQDYLPLKLGNVWQYEYYEIVGEDTLTPYWDYKSEIMKEFQDDGVTSYVMEIEYMVDTTDAVGRKSTKTYTDFGDEILLSEIRNRKIKSRYLLMFNPDKSGSRHYRYKTKKHFTSCMLNTTHHDTISFLPNYTDILKVVKICDYHSLDDKTISYYSKGVGLVYRQFDKYSWYKLVGINLK